jgi:hypothetical protein
MHSLLNDYVAGVLDAHELPVCHSISRRIAIISR